jgi:16S rRNA (guanine527-N7)-methyltransferase
MTSLAATLQALDLPPSLEGELDAFCGLFQKWNRRINLSAARGEDELRGHIIDSLHVVPHLRAQAAASSPSSLSMRVLDVGAGGGLPAVIAAICLPEVHVTALEPVHKKHAFLRTALRELSLANFAPHAERADQHPHHDYDAAMSRATFDLRDWLLLGLELVRPGGLVLGFEAVPRADLPDDTQRHPYRLDDRSRAIVTLKRQA